MIDCVSVENMRKSDAYTIANLVPGLELMYRAAWGVFKVVPCWKEEIAIVTGSGNNGGDGFALACILKDHGYSCQIFTVSEKLSADSTFYAQKAKDARISVRPFESGCLKGYGVVVDCLLGTGFQGNVRSNYRTVIEQMNESDAYVVCVDINSGMNGDTGEAELAVKSDLTVTIGFVKTGLIQKNAGNYIKKLRCVDIGIILAKEELKVCGQEEELLPGAYRCPEWLDMEIVSALDAPVQEE